MKYIYRRLRGRFCNKYGGVTIYPYFSAVGIAMLISFLLLYASIRTNYINIRNGAKMELNNLSTSIYADIYRSRRKTNFSEYLNTLYSSSSYTEMLEGMVREGLSTRVPLSTGDYKIKNIALGFHVTGDRVKYTFYCDVGFYVKMSGRSYPVITQGIELTEYCNAEF